MEGSAGIQVTNNCNLIPIGESVAAAGDNQPCIDIMIPMISAN